MSGSIKATSNVDFVIGGRSDGSGNWKGNLSEFILFDEVLEDSKVELYLQAKWLASAEPLYDSENSTIFEDQSGGDRPLFFYGSEQNNQSLFGASLGMDGATSFGKIELLDRNFSTKYLLRMLPCQTYCMHGGPLMEMEMIIRATKDMVNSSGMQCLVPGRFGEALDLTEGGFSRSRRKNRRLRKYAPYFVCMDQKTQARFWRASKMGNSGKRQTNLLGDREL